MRVLLDECVNPRAARAIVGHDVKSIHDIDWMALSDAQILERAAGQIEVFITLDQGFEFQHNLDGISFGIVIVHVKRNRLQEYEALADELRVAIELIRPGEILHVPRR
jgi:predicted nuclease of predicted toxin-antitoxin system